MKPLLLTLTAVLLVVAVAAQPAMDTGSHFLWFTGHWSATKKNVFVMASGGTVTVGNDGSVQVQTSDLDSWNKKWDQALKSEEQYIQQLDDPKDNLDPSTHQLYQLLKPDAEQRRQEAQDLKIDPKQDILSPDTKPGQAPSGQASPRTIEDAIGDACRTLRPDYDVVINWWKAHRSDKDGDLTYATPPGFDYDCYACDSTIRNKYEQTVDDYIRDFPHPEDSLVRKGLGIMRTMGLIGESAPSKSKDCSYMDLGQLSSAVHDIAIHLLRRADQMVRDNRKNFRAIHAIARTWCQTFRDVALLTGSTSNEDEGLRELADIAVLAIDHYYDEFRHNDWRQIGNLTWMLDLIRSEALLAGESDSRGMEYVGKLQKIWNGFKLSIEMDVKIGKDGGYRLAHLKGECHIIPAFQRDSNQCYKWVVADENQLDVLGFIKPAGQQSIDCNLIANEIITPPQAPKLVYVGTKKYTATLQSLAMDFCNPGHDTVMLTGFRPNPATAGTWQIPYAGTQNLGVNGMEHYFEDEVAKKKLAVNGDAKKSAEDMKQQAEELKKQMEQLKSQMTGPQAGANYEKMTELFNSTHKLGTAAITGKILWLFFLMPVQNNNNVLVDKRFDAKEINPGEAGAIQYGYYTIHIENDGNGKTKLPSKK